VSFTTFALASAEVATDAGPSLFDVFALIVVPGFVGLATVFIAVVSVLIARQSHQLTASMRAAEEKAGSLAERKELGELARNFVVGQMAVMAGDRVPGLELPGLIRMQMADQAGVSTQPFANDLHDEVVETSELLQRKVDARTHAVNTRLTADAILSIREWVKDPVAWNENGQERDAQREAATQITRL
jgi:hypothetical protein